MQPQSITRRFWAAAAAVATCAPLALHGCAGAQDDVDRRRPAVIAGGAAADDAALADFQSAPEFLSLFTPRVHRDAYRTFVSPLPLDDVLRRLAADPLRISAAGAWEARPTLPFDAFGETGTYDRFKLARAYGATRALVARGARGQGRLVTESWTLISPYPDADLVRLQPGTLLIVLTLPGR